MMTRTSIPVNIQSKLDSLNRQRQALERSETAARALLFFKDHAGEKTPWTHVCKVEVQIVPSSTSYAPEGRGYLNKAVRLFGDLIVNRAIELAMEDYQRSLAQVGPEG